MIKYPYLRAEMVLHGENQGKLAKVVGIKQSELSMRMSGKTRWTLDEVKTICKHYKKTVEELFKEEK